MSDHTRLYRQIADVPWLIVAGVLGFLVEVTLIDLQWTVFASPLWFWVKVVFGYGALLGFVSFLGRRRLAGAAGGAAAGAVVFAITRTLHVQLFDEPIAGGPSTAFLQPVVWALLPNVVDRIVSPWLLRGFVRTVVSAHPRFHYLRR